MSKYKHAIEPENIKVAVETLTDNELVDLIIRTKSSQLFSIIYDRYSSIVYNKCLSFVKNKAEAQDLTHDVFVKLFLKIRTFNFKSKFSTWLYSFTYNHCVNYLKRDLNKRKNKFLSTDNVEDYQFSDDEVDEKEIFELNAEKLETALQSIDPSDKMILLMKYLDSMTIEEIQEVLDLGKSAVKMRLSRAKSRLIEICKTV